ncbi:MAG: hypothetical protein R3190_19300, partial [Thermoanaerobaculia bacterium]|nr:hypothetical protein [Thermoanaerobaculia bacterium]
MGRIGILAAGAVLLGLLLVLGVWRPLVGLPGGSPPGAGPDLPAAETDLPVAGPDLPVAETDLPAAEPGVPAPAPQSAPRGQRASAPSPEAAEAGS